jgi:hypothetical protein
MKRLSAVLFQFQTSTERGLFGTFVYDYTSYKLVLSPVAICPTYIEVIQKPRIPRISVTVFHFGRTCLSPHAYAVDIRLSLHFYSLCRDTCIFRETDKLVRSLLLWYKSWLETILDFIDDGVQRTLLASSERKPRWIFPPEWPRHDTWRRSSWGLPMVKSAGRFGRRHQTKALLAHSGRALAGLEAGRRCRMSSRTRRVGEPG